MKHVAYLRVSTERQASDGNGLPQQRASICAYAALNNITIDEWVIDDETGTTEDREGIQALLKRSETFTLVFDRVDRLGRTLLVSENLFALFAARGVTLVCVAQQLTDTPMGRLTRQLMGAIAEYQRSEMLVRLSQCKQQAKAKRGTYGGGSVSYGYASAGSGRLVVDSGDAAMVRLCFDLRGQGKTLRGIVETLTEKGYRTRKGTEFYAAQIQRILARGDVYRAKENVGNVPLDAGVRPQQPAILS